MSSAGLCRRQARIRFKNLDLPDPRYTGRWSLDGPSAAHISSTGNSLAASEDLDDSASHSANVYSDRPHRHQTGLGKLTQFEAGLSASCQLTKCSRHSSRKRWSIPAPGLIGLEGPSSVSR
jgi:hypothetical protein